MSAPVRATPLLTFVIAGGAEPGALLGPELAEAEVLVVGAQPPSADPRVRALPADARPWDLGLAEAAGDYVWFLEGEARPAPGTIAAVAERLRAAAPDVLLVDRGAHRGLLGRVAGDGVASLDSRPGLAATAFRLADKVFRRAHLRELGVRFIAGPRGELPVTWPALLAAERVAAVPGARVSVPPPAAGSPAELRAAHDAVFAFVAAHPELPESRRRLVLPALVRQELAALRRRPASERSAAFAALSESVRRHQRAPGGREQRLVARGAYRTYAALETARRHIQFRSEEHTSELQSPS